MVNALELTDRQKDILRGALGLRRSKKPYRNHFATNPRSKDFQDCQQMEALGLMKSAPSETMVWFVVTEAGAKAINAELPED